MTRLTDMLTGRVGAVALGAWLSPALMGYPTDGLIMAFVFTHAWLLRQHVRQATLFNESEMAGFGEDV